MGSLIEPEKHVLSTLERDGSRRWIKPKLSQGQLLMRRRIVAYALIGLYAILPLVHINGEPFVLLDIVARRFTILGFTFLPTDTLLLALFMVGGLLGLFLATALFGRVWCGWACPHTVYMEFVFRPLERLFEGTTGKGGQARKDAGGGRKVAQYAVYFVVSWILANTFIAYFVGIKELGSWMLQSPFEHPAPFLIMGGVTGAMMFHFSFFREQLCIIACPYGRLQSGLLDEHSMIVAYHARRGEPRGKKSKKLPIADAAPLGDCVDCKLCVKTCPTGIDIRDGLQMECVNCTQCIDACDTVMKKVGREPGLIRYSSQSADAGGKKRLLRVRTVLYPVILSVIAAMFVVVLAGKQPFDAVVLRSPGQPFVMEEGRVRNQLKIKLTNRSDRPQAYVVTPIDANVDIELPIELVLDPDETQAFPLSVFADPAEVPGGQRKLTLEVVERDGSGRQTVDCTLLGPATIPVPQPQGQREAS